MSALPAHHAHRRASFRRSGSRTRSTVLMCIPLAIAALVLLSAERKWQSVTSRLTADRSGEWHCDQKCIEMPAASPGALRPHRRPSRRRRRSRLLLLLAQ